MNLRLPWLSCLVYFLSCTPADQKVPPDIMSIDSMKVIIWDMTLASEYASHQKEQDTARKPVNTAYFSEVLNTHHIDKSTFTRSFDFYQAHPALNKILWDSITIYAQKQRPQIYRPRQKAKIDSLRRTQPL